MHPALDHPSTFLASHSCTLQLYASACLGAEAFFGQQVGTRSSLLRSWFMHQ